MAALADLSGGLGDRPEMLTVAEAARRLGIGRTLAYQLVGNFLRGDPEGVPAIRLGGVLRVPCFALDERIRYGRVVSDLRSRVDALIDAEVGVHTALSAPTAATRINRSSHEAAIQLSLLDDC
jgi:hypothetical protein